MKNFLWSVLYSWFFLTFPPPENPILSDKPFTGMLHTEPPAMESNGDAFLPDLPVSGQTADCPMDQTAMGPLTNTLPLDSDTSQDVQMNAAELGSVEQVQPPQLYQEEQPPPPPQPSEEAQAPEHTGMGAEPVEGNQGN